MTTPKWVLEAIQETRDRHPTKLDLSNKLAASRLMGLNTDRHPIELDLRSGKNEPHLTKIPQEVFELGQLEHLDLSHNDLSEVPDSITRLGNLTRLNLNGNKLYEVPEAITQLAKLTRLYLSSNGLGDVPESIIRLSNLTHLYLSHNNLHEVRGEVGRLAKLRILDLSSNSLGDVPESIIRLSNLTHLYLSHNNFREVPDSITRLDSLECLDLSYNRLDEVPGSIIRLGNLTHLYLSHNNLREVPDITYLPNLTQLYLSGNPIEKPPPEVAERGIYAIHEYFRQLQSEGIDHIYEAKLLIVGEPGAGKTSLANKLIDPTYDLQPEEVSTEGIDVLRWDFPMDDGHDFRVNIWDFGGQEIYHATHQFFLTKRSLYAMVADTRKEDTDFHYWMNVVELLSDDSPLLIIKNEKQDRIRQINESRLRGRFTNLKEVLATNLADNRGLEKVQGMIKAYITRLPIVGTPLPQTWVRVREYLEKDPRNYISLDEYLAVCQQNDFNSRERALQLSSFLHDLGVFLHFQGDPILRNTVILKPEWGTDAVYKVLDNKDVVRNFGEFDRDDLTAIWQEEKYANMQEELLRLMLNFKLCYEIGDTGRFIAPQLLTENQPAYDWDEEANLLLRYEYDFMPKGILTQFIVAMHHFIADQGWVWKSGVILENDETHAEVVEYYDQRSIRVRIAGKHKVELRSIVRYELDKIHFTYYHLKYDELIPCNCASCKDSQAPHFYPFETLREMAAEGQDVIQCRKKPYKMANVLELIDDVLGKSHFTREDGDLLPDGDSEPDLDSDVFVSYAWGGESEKLVDELDAVFNAKGITIIRDKRDVGYKERIKAFMHRIGQGKCVIVVISEKYLKSENCMFEFLQIARNGKFYDRIFPIILADANIYKSVDRLQYVKYWETQIDELDHRIKEVSAANLQGIRNDIDLYTEIRARLPELIDILRDMNSLTADTHRASGFQDLIDAVEQKLKE